MSCCLSCVEKPILAVYNKLEAAGVGMNITWGKLIMNTMVSVNSWRCGKKPQLSNSRHRLWLWKYMRLGVKLQRILRAAKNSMMYQTKINIDETHCHV